MNHYLLFDFETTGLLVKDKNPAAIEIAFLLYNQKFEIIGEFESMIKPFNGCTIDDTAMKINGINLQELDEAPTESEIVEFICETAQSNFSKGKGENKKIILVGHNISTFDFIFLEKMFVRNKKNIFDYFQRYMVDTLYIARERWFEKFNKFSLSACLDLIGQENDASHTALGDVKANYLLHKYLTDCLRGGEINKNEEVDENVLNKDEKKYIKNLF